MYDVDDDGRLTEFTYPEEEPEYRGEYVQVTPAPQP